MTILLALILAVRADLELSGFQLREAVGFRYATPDGQGRVGDALMDKIASDLLTIRTRLGAAGPVNPTVVFCRGRRQFNSVVKQIGGEEPPPWAWAIAFPSRGVMVLSGDGQAIAKPAAHSRTITHEIVHLVLGSVPAHLPRWYHEGAAQQLSGEQLSDEMGSTLAAWAHKGDLVHLDELDRYLSHSPHRAEIFYRQSLSFVQYMTRRHGEDLHRRLLDELRQGGSFAEIYERASGTPLAEDEAAWRSQLALGFSLLRYVFGLLRPFSALAALCIAGYAYQRWRRRRQLLEMERLEALEPPSDLDFS